MEAGLHCGKVTTGEIGALKKEIIFTGDVLNATARIQGLCNRYEVDILVSAELIDTLNPDPEYQFKSMGKTELKGKSEYKDTVSRITNTMLTPVAGSQI